MRKIIVLLSCISFVTHACSQTSEETYSGEFKTYSKGLIYSPVTMGKLEYIVDSLNLKFKSCDLNKTYYALPQTVGHHFYLKKANIKNAKKDLENNISFSDFLSKYPQVEVKRNILIVKFNYEDEDDGEIIEFSEIDVTHGYGFDLDIPVKDDPEIAQKSLRNTWLFQHRTKKDYDEESLEGFFFSNEFVVKPMKNEYARMIAYADCLIDTTVLKFKETTTEDSYSLPDDISALSQEAKNELLEKLRSTKVVGYCSQDTRPRQHAINIALLSAEATNWEVFLKAHLDIMNDRFERNSDGNYAWAARKTYIRELEELDINVQELIFGISLRISNAAKNHYYGSIGRLGRALSESQDRKSMEKLMLGMIQDPSLDDYNRVLILFLFLNYNQYIAEKADKAENIKVLQAAINEMPIYLKEKIKIKSE